MLRRGGEGEIFVRVFFNELSVCYLTFVTPWLSPWPIFRKTQRSFRQRVLFDYYILHILHNMPYIAYIIQNLLLECVFQVIPTSNF